ncbi:uncharacterized protein TNCV_661961 [Trichonephila clavipes]|nr:uncharacterized protein TNCV_661961 [Trichonephila clavipes]
MTNDVNANWLKFKEIILTSAKLYIPRGNTKRCVPFFIHKDPLLEQLLMERKRLLQDTVDNSSRAKLNKINAKIKIAYAKLRQTKWRDICSKLDARVSDSKLWKIINGINREQPQPETCSTVANSSGQFSPEDKTTAN